MKSVKIDLTKFYNSKMFVFGNDNTKSARHPYAGDIDRLFPFGPSFDSSFSVEEANITLDIYKDDRFDNIMCGGQRIAVSEDKYSKIILTGFCMLGSFQDELELEYVDSCKENKEFFFYGVMGSEKLYSDFYNNFLSDNCKLLYKYINETGRTLNIWYYVMDIDKEKPLKAIVLPNNELFQIFNITLLR